MLIIIYTVINISENEVRWASTEWLEDNLQEDIIILDAQPNIHDYIQEHIPGAIYFNEGLLRVPLNGRPGCYVPTSCVESLLGRVGIDKRREVVVYTAKGAFSGWGDGLAQTMLTYSLARFGVKKVRILNGGLDRWEVEGRPLSKVFPEVEDTSFRADVHEELFIGYEEFKDMKDREDVILLDARPENLYEGQGPWIKPGHIPGARSMPWKKFMTPENTMLLKSDDDISALLKQNGIGKDKLIICSCGTGREATNEFLLFKWYLKYPRVKIYEGSFTEWSSYPDNPTVTGKNPR
ncbi:MAG: sulfurtransferase [Candidatus Methanofastidiosa archaeon]|nr:sulfurtransferase [Candidatus Methanofastidiosa archaeon]